MRKTIITSALVFVILVSMSSGVLALELERPGYHFTFDKRAERCRTDHKASVGLGVHAQKYYENDPGFPAYGNDYVKLRIACTGNTREIVSYDAYPGYYCWFDDLPYSVNLADDGGSWVLMDWVKVRFYGGPNSAEYSKVWVCSNGFVSFDPNRTFTNPYCPCSIPHLSEPNTFAAPFWRDLKPDLGGSVTCGIVWYRPGFGPYIECYCISWNGVPDKYGDPQTFQILMERAPNLSNKHRQSRIWFQYKSITLSDRTTIGIEDQQGGKGTSYDYLSLQNQTTLVFEQNSNSAFISKLRIRLVENDVNASTEIDTTPSFLRGMNVKLDQDLPDFYETYLMAIEGGATLLLSGLDLIGVSCPPAGLMIGAFFIALDWAVVLAREQKIAHFPVINSTFAEVHAVEDPDGLFVSDAIDASCCITAYWIFNETNPQRHDLNVTAELIYTEYNAYGEYVNNTAIPTSVMISISPDDNNSFDRATPIVYGTYDGLYIGGYDASDYYKINLTSGQEISFSAINKSPLTLFCLHLYDPNGTPVAHTEPGSYGRINMIADSTGYWYIEVRAYITHGLYSLYVTPPPAGGGGCPYLYVHDGSGYVCEGLLDIHDPDGVDTVAAQRLTATPKAFYGLYCLRLVEHPQTHSSIDQVKLYAVLEDNSTLRLPLVWAWHSEDGFVLPMLLFSDDWRITTLGADWNNGTSQSINLKFLALPPDVNAIGFIFQIEGSNPVRKM